MRPTIETKFAFVIETQVDGSNLNINICCRCDPYPPGDFAEQLVLANAALQEALIQIQSEPKKHIPSLFHLLSEGPDVEQSTS